MILALVELFSSGEVEFLLQICEALVLFMKDEKVGLCICKVRITIVKKERGPGSGCVWGWDQVCDRSRFKSELRLPLRNYTWEDFNFNFQT